MIIHYTKKTVYSLMLIGFLSNVVVLSVDIGSDTAVTRFTTQQTVNNGDRIAGFAALKAGFRLSGTNVTGTFDSFFPVSGNVEFNGGTLVLEQDLILHNVSWIGFIGDIIGKGHTFELSSSVTCLPNVGDVHRGCQLILITETAEDDNVETLDWSYDSQYLAFGTDINTATQPLGIYQFNGSNLTLKSKIAIGSGTETEINSVRWHPSLLRLGIVREPSTGSEIFVYDFTGSSLIQRSAAEYGANCLACAWHKTGSYLAVGGQNTSSEIRVYPVSAGGILGAPLNVNITPDRSVFDESLEFDFTGSYLAAGVNASGGNPTLLIYNFNTAPSLSLTLNASVNTGAGVSGLSWNRTYTDVIAVGLTGTAAPRVIVYRHNAAAGTLTQINTIGLPFTSQIEGVHWTPGGRCLMLGSDEIGTGPEDAHLINYYFDNATGSLTQVTRIDEGDDIEAIRSSPDGCYFAYGDDGFGDPVNLTVMATGDCLLTRDCVRFTDVHIVLNCDVCFQSCCIIFSGKCSISGQGHILDIKPTCTIAIDKNASLLLKNIDIKGLNEYQLFGLDMNSTVSFEDTTIILDNDYTFTQGRFDVIGDLNIVGNGRKFTYKSRSTSTIQKNGIFLFDRGVTFSYDPPIASQSLLQLADDNATIVLDGATFHTTTTGMRISRGVFEVQSQSNIVAEGVTENRGVIFGNAVAGTSVNLKIRPSAVLNVGGCVQVDTV